MAFFGGSQVNNGAVAGLAAVAVLFALGFAVAGFFLSPGNAAIPTSLVFTMIAILAGIVARRFKSHSDRIDRLERLLESKSNDAVEQAVSTADDRRQAAD